MFKWLLSYTSVSHYFDRRLAMQRRIEMTTPAGLESTWTFNSILRYVHPFMHFISPMHSVLIHLQALIEYCIYLWLNASFTF